MGIALHSSVWGQGELQFCFRSSADKSHCALHVTNEVLWHLRFPLGIFLVSCPLAVTTSPLTVWGSLFLLIYFIVVWASDLFPPPEGRPPGPGSLSVCRVFAHGFVRKFFNLSNSLHFWTFNILYYVLLLK